MKTRCRRVERSTFARMARAKAKFRLVRDASDQGKTKEEAAALVGMTVSGVNHLLRRNVGHQHWPILSPINQDAPKNTGE
jgi:hypothetical protein